MSDFKKIIIDLDAKLEALKASKAAAKGAAAFATQKFKEAEIATAKAIEAEELAAAEAQKSEEAKQSLSNILEQIILDNQTTIRDAAADEKELQKEFNEARREVLKQQADGEPALESAFDTASQFAAEARDQSAKIQKISATLIQICQILKSEINANYN